MTQKIQVENFPTHFTKQNNPDTENQEDLTREKKKKTYRPIRVINQILTN